MCYCLRFNAPTMLPAGGLPATSWVHYTASCNTQSSAPEDGQNNCPKHVELIGIINKPLLLHLVGVYIVYINDAQSNKYQKKRINVLGGKNGSTEHSRWPAGNIVGVLYHKH